jgi:hypothetical protein
MLRCGVCLFALRVRKGYVSDSATLQLLITGMNENHLSFKPFWAGYYEPFTRMVIEMIAALS